MRYLQDLRNIKNCYIYIKTKVARPFFIKNIGHFIIKNIGHIIKNIGSFIPLTQIDIF